jgi:hypothetical protein
VFVWCERHGRGASGDEESGRGAGAEAAGGAGVQAEEVAGLLRGVRGGDGGAGGRGRGVEPDGVQVPRPEGGPDGRAAAERVVQLRPGGAGDGAERLPVRRRARGQPELLRLPLRRQPRGAALPRRPGGRGGARRRHHPLAQDRRPARCHHRRGRPPPAQLAPGPRLRRHDPECELRPVRARQLGPHLQEARHRRLELHHGRLHRQHLPERLRLQTIRQAVKNNAALKKPP